MRADSAEAGADHRADGCAAIGFAQDELEVIGAPEVMQVVPDRRIESACAASQGRCSGQIQQVQVDSTQSS